MKVDKVVVLALKREVSWQIKRVRRYIELDSTKQSLWDSLNKLMTLREMLNGLLLDGELVLHGSRWGKQSKYSVKGGDDRAGDQQEETVKQE